MATNRKPKPPTGDTSVPLPASKAAAELATFMGLQEPDEEQLERATELAMAAAAEFIGAPLPDLLPHPLRQGIMLLASKLVLQGIFEGPITEADIPLTARYYFRLAAGAQG